MKQTLMLILVCILYSSVFAQSQAIITGTVVDNSANHNPLAYVSIGVAGKNAGTLTDSKGNFSLSLDDAYNSDTLRISMLGYKSVAYKVADFKKMMQQKPEIVLFEKSQQLQEIEVVNRKLKQKVLGNTSTSSFGTTFASDKLGNEMGTLIKIKSAPAYLKSFSTNIVANEHDSIKFRLNFYTVAGGMPGESLLNHNIIVVCKIKAGELKVDLSQYNIVVQDDFFVALEWIESFDTGGIRFSTGFLGSPTIVKLASQSNWEKIGALSVGFNITAEY